jgi:hypothetical protein
MSGRAGDAFVIGVQHGGVVPQTETAGPHAVRPDGLRPFALSSVRPAAYGSSAPDAKRPREHPSA